MELSKHKLHPGFFRPFRRRTNNAMYTNALDLQMKPIKRKEGCNYVRFVIWLHI